MKCCNGRCHACARSFPPPGAAQRCHLRCDSCCLGQQSCLCASAPQRIRSGAGNGHSQPLNPSYPSEYAVTAGAASTMLAWLVPEEAQFFRTRHRRPSTRAAFAGVEYPSDVEAGLALGQQVAELVISVANPITLAPSGRAVCPPRLACGRAKIPCSLWPERGNPGCCRRPINSAPTRRPPTIQSN